MGRSAFARSLFGLFRRSVHRFWVRPPPAVERQLAQRTLMRDEKGRGWVDFNLKPAQFVGVGGMGHPVTADSRGNSLPAAVISRAVEHGAAGELTFAPRRPRDRVRPWRAALGDLRPPGRAPTLTSAKIPLRHHARR